MGTNVYQLKMQVIIVGITKILTKFNTTHCHIRSRQEAKKKQKHNQHNYPRSTRGQLCDKRHQSYLSCFMKIKYSPSNHGKIRLSSYLIWWGLTVHVIETHSNYQVITNG